MSTATASIVAAPIAAIYLTNEQLFAKALAGLSEQDLWHQPMANCNPMLWIAGHVAEIRTVVLRLLGAPYDTQWGELFGRGAALKDSSLYPPVSEIAAMMKSVSERLHTKLASVEDEQLAGPAAGPPFPNCVTLADQIAFLALHDSYHIGQMAYLRKALGHDRLVG